MNIYMELFDSRIKKVKDGEIIIQEGTWPYYAYILKEGKARVLKNVGGKQVLIDLLTEGDIFGEISFLVKTKRTVSVIAGMDRRHSVAVEGLNKLSFQVERRRIRQLNN